MRDMARQGPGLVASSAPRRRRSSELAASQSRTLSGGHDQPPQAEEEDDNDLHGWIKTWVWTLAGALVYLTAQWLVQYLIPTDVQAYAHLTKQVPPLVYKMSSTAFFTALVLNLTSLLFEDNAPKRQLALLSCAIKAAACHSDMLLVTGRATVTFDTFGAIVIPQRSVQWLVTTPTMVYILSKISDFTPVQTAVAIALDMLMVLTGLWANFLPTPYNWIMFWVSSIFYVFTLYAMGRMVHSAVKEHSNANSRRSLLFIYMCTLFIWTLFPIGWVLHAVQPNAYGGEILTLFANFMAKVLFSSSIMYGNYMTIKQRRLLAQQAAENAHRIAMIADLRDAVTRKDQFMSLMSHELRTPLNGIIQLSDALVRGAGGEMNPKGQHFTKTIKNSSNHLLNIINDILDVAALKEGKLTIKHEVCCLGRAVEHVVDIVAPLAKKEVAIERSVDPRTPMIIADASRVIQILYNLTGNALKFTHKGKVAVRVAPGGDGTKVTMQVSDTGIGIPPERLDSIWGAFEQVDMSVTRKYGGTGLGLNIVKQLVEAHEGSIEVRSAEGSGTTFTVTLPVLQSSTRRSLELQVLESLDKCGHGKGREVLTRRLSSNLTRRISAPNTSEEHGGFLPPTRGSTGSTALGHGFGQGQRRGSESTAGHGAHDSDNSPGPGGPPRDELIRKRTMELERDAVLGDLARRTETKRSMDEADLASRQLWLSGSERRAERDSRSLDRQDTERDRLRRPSAAGGAGAASGIAGAGAGGKQLNSGGSGASGGVVTRLC